MFFVVFTVSITHKGDKCYNTALIGSNTRGLKNIDFVRTHSESVIFTFDPQSADSSNVYFVLFFVFSVCISYFTYKNTLQLFFLP